MAWNLIGRQSRARQLARLATVAVPQTEPWPTLPKIKYAKIDETHQPTTQVMTLANGVRCASHDLPGSFATVGVLVDFGSRFETAANQGVAHMLDRMAYKSTSTRPRKVLIEQLEAIGGNAMSQGSRDTMMYFASVLPGDIPLALELLSDVANHSLMLPEEVDEQRDQLRYELQEMNERPETAIAELIHKAAYGDHTLGQSMICPEDRIELITPQMLLDCVGDAFIGPRMTVAAAGVEHEAFQSLCATYFKDVPANPKRQGIEMEKAVYVGGKAIQHVEKSEFLHMAVAFEGVSWAHDDIYAAATLQMLMGGGDAFSAGGPGKGMYSRLYLNVLNGYGFMEQCTAFNTSYVDSGIFGITAACLPGHAANAMHIIKRQLFGMLQPISGRELRRAKNQLASSLLMNLDSKAILMEDVGKQVLMTGKRIPASELCEKIENVTESDIHKLAYKLLQSVPSVAFFGNLLDSDVENIDF